MQGGRRLLLLSAAVLVACSGGADEPPPVGDGEVDQSLADDGELDDGSTFVDSARDSERSDANDTAVVDGFVDGADASSAGDTLDSSIADATLDSYTAETADAADAADAADTAEAAATDDAQDTADADDIAADADAADADGHEPCAPSSCATAGASCGVIVDGCGAMIDCGSCTVPLTCGGGGTPNVCGCTPTSCAAAGKNCGTIPNGCGATLVCGSCPTGEACGAGGVANVCACVPTTCAASAKSCGLISNGCGGTLDCGTCVAPHSCGGSGTPNVCGCTKKTCVSVGATCGTISDGCGGAFICGTCSAPNTCGGGGTPNVCGCTKLPCTSGSECGTMPDGCGGTASCGTCATGYVCDTTARKCNCAPTTCAAAGRTCGTMPDGCGGTLVCTGCSGTCAGDVCKPYDVTKSAVCSPVGFCFRHPLPQPNSLRDAFALSETDQYAVGMSGTIIHSDALKWTGVTGLGTQRFNGVWAASTSDVWVVGDSGVVLRGSAASGWTPVALPSGAVGARVSAIFGTSASNVVMVGNLSGVPVIVRWDGTALTSMTPPSTSSTAPTGVYETAPSNMWMSTTRGIWHWNGSTWTAEDATANFNSIWGTGAEIFAAGDTIKRRTGTSWTAMTTPSSFSSYMAIFGLGPSTVYAVANNYMVSPNTFQLHRWNGTSWLVDTSATRALGGVAATSDLGALMVGSDGSIRRRYPWGGSDPQDLSVTPHPLTASSGLSRGDVWFAGKTASTSSTAPKQGLLHWNGTAWDATVTASVNAVWASGPASAFYAHDNTTTTPAGIYRTTVGAAPVLERAGNYYGVWGSSQTDVWAVGLSAATARRVGATWTSVPNPLTSTSITLFAISGTASNDVWAAGELGSLIHWDGSSWATVPSGTSATITALWAAASNDAWATTATQVLRWNGTSWSLFQTIGGASLASIHGSGAQVWAAGGGAYRLNAGMFEAVTAGTGTTPRTLFVDGAASSVLIAGDLGHVIEGALTP